MFHVTFFKPEGFKFWLGHKIVWQGTFKAEHENLISVFFLLVLFGNCFWFLLEISKNIDL